MEKGSFELFIDLITFDQSLSSTEKAIVQLHSEIQQMSGTLENLLDDIKRKKEHVHVLRKAVDEKELEMKTLDEQEKQARKKLSTVSNDNEYQALKNEASTLKKQQHDYEETLMEVWSIFETAQKEFQKNEKEIISQKEEVEKQLQEKKSEVEGFQKSLDASMQERVAKEKDVPEEWLEKYARMRNSVPNPVAPVDRGSCSVCFYTISDQDALLIKRHQLIQCKGCYRFLYGNQEEEPSE